MEPNVTAQPWPTNAIAAARAGVKPSMMSSGAATATGTPNPVMPWMKLEKPQPMMSACASPSPARAVMLRPIESMAFSLSSTLYRYTDVQTMVRTKSDRLMPFAAAMAAWPGSAPKTSRASASASTQAPAPTRGTLQLSHTMAATRNTTGEAASSQLKMVISGPFTSARLGVWASGSHYRSAPQESMALQWRPPVSFRA